VSPQKKNGKNLESSGMLGEERGKKKKEGSWGGMAGMSTIYQEGGGDKEEKIERRT